MTRHRSQFPYRSLLLAFLLGTLGAGCVSVNLSTGKTVRSTGVTFQPPTTPFEPLASTKADGAWQNKANGNSISYFSSCNDPADPPLGAVAQELFADMANLKTIRSQTLSYNGREALSTEVEGQVDGVPTRVQSLVFKKNDCLYTLSYIGVAKNFGQNQSAFDEFVGSFQAP